ncbi:hypothetical protein [Rubritalea tangerina]|uniref:hypothetical protein n=1 Tax=Rubritalea tangerina TaxID=430798 RepID=UPI00361E3361
MPEGEGPPYKTGVDVIERYFGELFEIEWIREPSSYYRVGRERASGANAEAGLPSVG